MKPRTSFLWGPIKKTPKNSNQELEEVTWRNNPVYYWWAHWVMGGVSAVYFKHDGNATSNFNVPLYVLFEMYCLFHYSSYRSDVFKGGGEHPMGDLKLFQGRLREWKGRNITSVTALVEGGHSAWLGKKKEDFKNTLPESETNKCIRTYIFYVFAESP